MLRGRPRVYFIYHIALWVPLLFATPLFVALQNLSDIRIQVAPFIASLFLVTLAASFLSFFLAAALGERLNRAIAILALSVGTVVVIQGNIVHELFQYGQFNGQEVNWRTGGWRVWLESLLYVMAIPALYALLTNRKKISLIVPIFLLGSSASMVLPKLLNLESLSAATPFPEASGDSIDESVFEFSSETNLIHLIPDGFQADVVKQVLEENPSLKQRFQGFTFFDNHSAQFQATAPSIPTIYNGAIYDLNEGHDWNEVTRQIEEQAYQNTLLRADFGLDFVSITEPYCSKGAHSCVVRGFGDLKARGYFDSGEASSLYGYLLIADLVLFRHVPILLKEKIYADGRWLFSDTEAAGASPYPDPVIREWMANIEVTDREPKYKSYHYIGTHIPPRWNRDCQYVASMERIRGNYLEQTYCVLNSLTDFLETLKQHDIYDRTAIVITGDHGNNTAANDIIGETRNTAFHPRLIGHARPAFMVKRLDSREPLNYSDKPTSMIDIAPTALDLVGMEGQFDGTSALVDSIASDEVVRTFHFYSEGDYWSGSPVPYVEYEITGEVQNIANWRIGGIHNAGIAPSSYDQISRDSIGEYSFGLGLSDANQAWVFGSEFAFLISRPQDAFRYLTIRLHSPDDIEDQALTVSINGQPIDGSFAIEQNDDFWTSTDIPVDESFFGDENNFVKIEMATTGRAPENPEVPLGILVTSIGLR